MPSAPMENQFKWIYINFTEFHKAFNHALIIYIQTYLNYFLGSCIQNDFLCKLKKFAELIFQPY